MSSVSEKETDNYTRVAKISGNANIDYLKQVGVGADGYAQWKKEKMKVIKLAYYKKQKIIGTSYGGNIVRWEFNEGQGVPIGSQYDVSIEFKIQKSPNNKIKLENGLFQIQMHCATDRSSKINAFSIFGSCTVIQI